MYKVLIKDVFTPGQHTYQYNLNEVKQKYRLSPLQFEKLDNGDKIYLDGFSDTIIIELIK